MSNAIEVFVTNAGAKLGLPAQAEYTGQVVHGLRHPSLLMSGASREESRRALPGDDLVPRPQWQRTRAETIRAPVADVWPWLVQMGYGRGGYYGWFPFVDDEAWLERHGVDADREREAAGATRIIPEFQRLQMGDVLLDGPGCGGDKGIWTVKQIVPGRVLALYSCRDIFSGREYVPQGQKRTAFTYEMGWVFVLDEIDRNTTRLLIRTRVRGNVWLRLLRPFVLAIMGTGDTVMQRTILQGIKRRAELVKGAGSIVRGDTGAPATTGSRLKDI